MRLLAIDPGTPFGFALFNNGQLEQHGTKRQTGRDHAHNLCLAGKQFADLIDTLKPELIACEQPFYIEGHAAAASGSLVKLSMIYGCLIYIANRRKVTFRSVPVNEWMGQLTGAAIKYHIKEILGPEVAFSLGEHDRDAVGIGLHVEGKWI